MHHLDSIENIDRSSCTYVELISTLKFWAQAGLIRAVDWAFARWVGDMSKHNQNDICLAALCLSAVQGEGHTCLPLESDASIWKDSEVLCRLQHLIAGLEPGCMLKGLGGISVEILALAHDGFVDTHQSPLILDAQRLYLRRSWMEEQTVRRHLKQRAQYMVDGGEMGAIVQDLLNRLFEPLNQDVPNLQRQACVQAIRRGLSIITGGPGTGKTHTVARLLAVLWAIDPNMQVALAAPTGKAAVRIQEAIDAAWSELSSKLGDSLLTVSLEKSLKAQSKAQTLHRLLGWHPGRGTFRYNAQNKLPFDVLMVDEASMIDLSMMAALLEAIPDNARLIILGDRYQLASVEPGRILADLCAYPWPSAVNPVTELTVSRRFSGAIKTLAERVFSVSDHLASVEAVHEILRNGGNEVACYAWDQWLKQAQQDWSLYKNLVEQGANHQEFQAWVLAVLSAFDRVRVLCAVRQGERGVAAVNEYIEWALWKKRSALTPWYAGRPVMVTSNHPQLQLFNGDIGIILPDSQRQNRLRAYFKRAQDLFSLSVVQLPPVETAYALTVHKAQGSEYDHSILILPNQDSRVLTWELMYTGLTRARSRFSLVVDTDNTQQADFSILDKALRRRTRRSSGLNLPMSTP